MQRLFEKALDIINTGEPIIVPTDTVYGLVCRYNSKSAVGKIYKLKRRSRRKPLILLGYNWNALKKFIKSSTHTSYLIPHTSQWPGPLTIILPASKKVPKFLNKRFKTIGIRVPNNKFLLRLLQRCPGKVLASTSANLSGKKDVKEIAKNVKLFIKAKKGEMSNKPSRIIEIDNNKVRTLR